MNHHETEKNTETALLFPGQGAQYVGMGQELCAEFASARKVYEEASEALGYDLADISFNGPEQMLLRTDICQPAILTASFAACRALQEASLAEFRPAACAGLSLGEYSALTAAGCLELTAAVKLTAARGAFMQQACEARHGTMYCVIGLEHGEVERICSALRDAGASVWAANYNSPDQVVLSGEEKAAGEAAALCEDSGARKTVKLDVAGAFHTPLMEHAASRLEEELAGVDFARCAFPVISNVTARPHGGPRDIREALSKQVTHPVRWMQSMQWCGQGGITRFLEVGPGKVLSGLLRRIDSSLDCTPVFSPRVIRELRW